MVPSLDTDVNAGGLPMHFYSMLVPILKPQNLLLYGICHAGRDASGQDLNGVRNNLSILRDPVEHTGVTVVPAVQVGRFLWDFLCD